MVCFHGFNHVWGHMGDVEYETLDYVTSKLGLLLRVRKVRNFHLSKWTSLPVPWMERFLRAEGKWWYRLTRDLTRSRVGYWLIFISVFFLQKKPCQGNTILFRSSQQLPCLLLRPLKGFLSWHGALQEPSTHLVHCFGNYRSVTRRSLGVRH